MLVCADLKLTGQFSFGTNSINIGVDFFGIAASALELASNSGSRQ